MSNISFRLCIMDVIEDKFTYTNRCVVFSTLTYSTGCVAFSTLFYPSFIQVTTETGKLIKTKRVLLCTGAFTKFKNLGPVKNLKMVVHRECAVMIKIDQEESNRMRYIFLLVCSS